MGESGEKTLGPHPAPGHEVGGYRIQTMVGMGAMATVFRAVDPRGVVVALKVLNPARVLPEDVKRFTREYRALSRMSHPNVVAVFHAGIHEGYPWIAMEYVDGTDLGTLIERWKDAAPVDRFARAERILRGLCKGLQYIHDLGLIHRDLKPGNVLVTADGEPKITDFGMLKADETSVTHHTQLTMAGRLVGTVAFMAPELITEEGVDRRADLYGLGAVLYVLLTGHRPIEATSVAGYLARHLTEVPRPAGELDPAVPRRLERIAARLLLKDKALRYPTAAAVLHALDRRDEEERPPLRGRDDALAAWRKALTALRDGVGGVRAYVGPSGSGKSRLLDACVEQVDTTEFLLHRCNPGQRLPEGLAARIAGRRSLIVVDDLDRVEPDQIVALAALVRDRVGIEAEPLLVLFASNPPLPADLPQTLRRRSTPSEVEVEALLRGESTGLPCEVVELGPVEVTAAVALMRDHAVVGAAAPLLGRRLHSDYVGRPGAIVQQLDALREAGWLVQVGDGLKPARPLEALRREDLPVPNHVEADIEQRIRELDPHERLLVELLSVVDGTAPTALLERCAPNTPDLPRVLDRLVQREILVPGTHDAHQEISQFAQPCLARVVRKRLDTETRRARHRAVADALTAWRRRASPLEIARHRELSGDPAAAYPLYVTAARRAARHQAHGDVLDIATRAEALRPLVEPILPRTEMVQHRRALALLEGEAHLARGSWADAQEPLERALSAARAEDDAASAARCLAGLGRAHLRRNRFTDAAPLLEEALTRFEPGAADSMTALRALADIRLRDGDMAASEALWRQALEIAEAVGSKDGEARARRGLAHLRGVEGRLQEAAETLDLAEELLAPDGDARVRAGILARSIEFDAAAGRYGAAVRRAEALVDLVRRREMAERLPETYALLAEVLVAVGDPGEAEDAAHQALVFALAHQVRPWDAQIRAARVLCNIGKLKEASRALPAPEDVPQHKVDDPAGQIAALRARLIDSSPTQARDLAMWAMTREPPLMALRTARIALDAALALTAAGQSALARNAVKRGLKALHGPGADGTRLELLLAMHLASPDDRVLVAAGQVAHRIHAGLSPALANTFGSRPPVAAALARWGVD